MKVLGRALWLEVMYQEWLADVFPGSDCPHAREAFMRSGYASHSIDA